MKKNNTCNNKILVILFLLFSGCGNKVQNNTAAEPEKKSDTYKNVLPQKKIRGMYEVKNNTGSLADCETGSRYVVSKEGDVKILDSVYSSFNKLNPGRKLYVSLEGFNSVKEKSTGNNFDTILVITKLSGIDTAYNCQK